MTTERRKGIGWLVCEERKDLLTFKAHLFSWGTVIDPATGVISFENTLPLLVGIESKLENGILKIPVAPLTFLELEWCDSQNWFISYEETDA